jgi:hypothetical protein
MLHCHGIAEAISNRIRTPVMKVGHHHRSQMGMRLTMSPKAWRKAAKAVWWTLWCQTVISIKEFLCPYHGMNRRKVRISISGFLIVDHAQFINILDMIPGISCCSSHILLWALNITISYVVVCFHRQHGTIRVSCLFKSTTCELQTHTKAFNFFAGHDEL